MITATEEGGARTPRSTRFHFWSRKTTKNKKKTNKINDKKLKQKNKDLQSPPLDSQIEPSPPPRIQRLIAKEGIYGDPRTLQTLFPSKYQHQIPSPRSSTGNHQCEAPMTCSAKPDEKRYKKTSKGFADNISSNRKTTKNKRKTNKIYVKKLKPKNKDLQSPSLGIKIETSHPSPPRIQRLIAIKIEPSPPLVQQLIAKEGIYRDSRPLQTVFPSKYHKQFHSPRSSTGNHQCEAPMTCSAKPDDIDLAFA